MATSARAEQDQNELVPSRAGYLGAWLALGPLAAAKDATLDTQFPLEGAEATLAPVLGATGAPASAMTRSKGKGPPDPSPMRWRFVTSKSGAIDLREQLGAPDGSAVAYLGATLVVREALHAYLLLGATGSYRVFIDGKPVASRASATGFTTDGDEVPLDLAPGKHRVVLKLLRTGSDWLVRTRFVSDKLSRPNGLSFELPGTGEKDGSDLFRRLTYVHLARNYSAQGYQPMLSVRFSEGHVGSAGPPLSILVREADTTSVFDVGPVPLSDDGTTVHLPLFGGDAPRSIDASLGDASHTFTLSPHPKVREALKACDGLPKVATLPSGTDVSLQWETERLATAISHDERDETLLEREASALSSGCREHAQGKPPFAGKTGAQRRAILSPADGQPSEFGLYVPPSYREDATRKYPLIVALHGMNGKPLAMLRWFFGGDDEHKDQNWEERHLENLPTLDAFVVSPGAHGNAMYRGAGEDDVLRVMEWVKQNYRIDDRRVSITGPSMGGIGTAAIAFHHPDLFSAAAPLCGYHSTFLRGDVMGKRLRPWEQFLAEERSNVSWAENGLLLPLYIVHGKRDLPEANSGVLIERYEKLHYSVKHEHPDLGHNVWQKTYEDAKGAKWLLSHTRPAVPKRVRFRSGRSRYDASYWLRITRSNAQGWAEVDATRRTESEVVVGTASGVDELTIAKEAFSKWPAVIVVGGARFEFGTGETPTVHRVAEAKGHAFGEGPAPKTPTAPLGPIRDVWHDPLVFVYGTRIAAHAFANEQVARSLAQGRWGTIVHYPVVSDVEFERTPMPDRSIVLVGRASENSVLQTIETSPSEATFPIRIVGDEVVLANGKHYGGPEVGAMFVVAHPLRPARRVLVVEGVTPMGTFRALSLPDLLPDYIVYDRRIAPARDHTVLGPIPVVAAGFFGPNGALSDDRPDAANEGPSPR